MQELMEREDIPFATSLKISKNANLIDEHLKHYQQEQQKIYEECLERDENGMFVRGESGNGYKIKPSKTKTLYEKQDSLDAFDVDIDIKMIGLDELRDLKISPKILAGIMFMIEESEDE